MSEDDAQLVPAANGVYSGAAWRSRFLRAPKIAVEIASRPDFVALEVLASTKLGLKTGADSFFFLERLPRETGDGGLIPRKGLVALKGYNGWRGEISLGDILPAVLNPHQLFIGNDRRFSIPTTTKHVYLYPKPGKPRSGLLEYVKLAELDGVQQGDLVLSNADENRWYRQVRSLVSSEWVVPYNSAYDYGAWHNPNRAVLNGRFLGVDPLPGIDSELLGACLNSTFAAVGRLIEGVATGVEGAFDVGPPAARKIMVPDVRRFDAKAISSVHEAFSAIRKTGLMTGAPQRDGEVSLLRRNLDASLLVGLGLTKGQAATVLDRLYASYGRWRTNVENVETQMRINRRQMQATGQSRNQRPVETAGKRVWEEIEHLFPLYPRGLLSSDEVLEVVHLPVGAAISLNQPLFDAGTIRTKTKVLNLGSFQRVRYAGMLQTIGLVGSIEVPVSETKAGAISDLFEKDQRRFMKLAIENSSKYISGASSIGEAADIAQKFWFAACRKSATSKAAAASKASRLN